MAFGMRTWAVIAGVASAVGSAVGLLMVNAAVRHNPQGAVIDQATGTVDYPYLIVLFLSWFLPIGVAAGLFLAGLVFAVQR